MPNSYRASGDVMHALNQTTETKTLITSRETRVTLPPQYTPVTIGDLPLINIFDLSKGSHNMQVYKSGTVKGPQDLECQVITDDKLV